MSRLLPFGYQVMDGNGKPYSGALLHCYATATLIPHDSWYSEASIGTGAGKNANPVVSDSNGYFGNVYGDSSAYSLVMTTAAGAVIWSNDPVYGDITAKPQMVSASSANATSAVKGENTSSGIGGEFTSATGTGYGAKSTGNATKPPLFLTPQAAPSSLLAGGVWPDLVTGKLSTSDGTREQRTINQVHAIVSAESRAVGSAFSTSALTIPGNTVRVGQTIRIKALFTVSAVADGDGTVEFYLRMAGVDILIFAFAPAAGTVITTGSSFFIDADIVVLSLGSPGSMYVSGTFKHIKASASQVELLSLNSTGIDTTAAMVFDFSHAATGGGVSYSASLVKFTVDMSS